MNYWVDSTGGKHLQSHWLAGRVQGLPKSVKNVCYMPNAAIGWKQPNGFFYPIPFDSTNLFFQDVDIRHFVLEPLFEPGTFTTDVSTVSKEYCLYDRNLFTGFTDIDRQTVLRDLDGSLTGYRGTVSVNLDPFFDAPVEAIECRSDDTAKTSLYEYVSTVIYPHCAKVGTCAIPPPDPPKPNPHIGEWDRPCTNEKCYGIPLTRQLLTTSDTGVAKTIRMMGQSRGPAQQPDRQPRRVLRGHHGGDAETARRGLRQPQAGSAVLHHGVQAGGDLLSVHALREGHDQADLPDLRGQGDFLRRHQGRLDDPGRRQARAHLLHGPQDAEPAGGPDHPLLPAKWKAKYTKSTGILQVDIDLADFEQKFVDGGEDACRPFSYCSWDAGTRKCNDRQVSLTPGGGQASASDAVCRWAVAGLDCPKGGCFGIGFKLPKEFEDRSTHGPSPPRGVLPEVLGLGRVVRQARRGAQPGRRLRGRPDLEAGLLHDTGEAAPVMTGKEDEGMSEP